MPSLIKNERDADNLYDLELSKRNTGEASGITTFPYFCAFLLRRFLETWQQLQSEEKAFMK